MNNQGRNGQRSLIILLVAVIVLIGAITLAGYAYVNRDGQGAKAEAAQGQLTTAPSTKSSTATVTSSPTAPAPVTPGPTPTVIPTSTPTQTTQPVPFSVAGINVSANPSTFHGTCTNPMIFTFTATIKVPAGTAGGMVTYHWLRSDGATAPAETVTFNPGVTTRTVTITWQLGAAWGNGSTFWEALQVTAPNSVTSTHANFSFVCQFTVTSINASVLPGAHFCGQPVWTFNFSATITLSPGPNGGNITYTWERSDGGATAPITISVPAGQTTVTVTDSWALGGGAPVGSYWEQVVVTGPNSITSNKATFTKFC